MCLGTVISTKRDRQREGIGWKVFNTRDGKLHGEFKGKPERKEGIWLKSKDDGSENYPLGFHILQTRKEARRWKSYSPYCLIPSQRVRKVRWRDLLAEGMQVSDLRTIVAKEMMII